MATTYSTSLNLAYIGTGDQSGTWGATTNTNLGLIEQAITGVTSISLSGTSYTLVPLNGVSDVPRNMVLVFGGTPSGNVTVTAPLVQKFYVITNNTAYNIIMAATGGSISLTIPSGITAQCYCDGSTGFYSAQTGSAGNFLVNGNLTVTGNTTDVGNLSVSGTATLSGTSTAVTATLGDNTTKIATTAFVTTAVNTATGSLGSMSTQNANSVAITGGTINNTIIGGSTAAAGTFTTLGGTTITASSQFSGPGTGLTGTASGLNIGGNAATATSATSATNATTANALNSANSYSVAGLTSSGPITTTGTGTDINSSGNLIAGGGYVQAGLSSGQYAKLRFDGALSLNGGAYAGIVRNDSGTYAINISGTANQAASLVGGNSYSVNSLTTNGLVVNNTIYTNGFQANNGGITIGNASSGGAYITINYDGVMYKSTTGTSDYIVRTGDNVNFSGCTVNNTVTCWGSDGTPGSFGWAMVNSDHRIGLWSVAVNYIQVIIDNNAYGINIFLSDEKVKKDIVPSTYNALNTVKQIQFKEFDYDETKSIMSGHVKCGISAQQIQSIDSNLVKEQGEFLSPKVDEMLYVALKAIQELKVEVDSLKTELAVLKG